MLVTCRPCFFKLFDFSRKLPSWIMSKILVSMSRMGSSVMSGYAQIVLSKKNNAFGKVKFIFLTFFFNFLMSLKF